MQKIGFIISWNKIRQIWPNFYIIWDLFPGFLDQGVHFWGQKNQEYEPGKKLPKNQWKGKKKFSNNLNEHFQNKCWMLNIEWHFHFKKIIWGSGEYFTRKLNGYFLGKTSMSKSFQMIFGVWVRGIGGTSKSQNGFWKLCYKTCVPQVKKVI